jgi:hypothetical protein
MEKQLKKRKHQKIIKKENQWKYKKKI